ncbi:MAG TPA: hypothetical protein VFW30_10775 [Bryocella sp.]|nr:hypothetical protein [Bryocella sp.]
MDRERIQSVNKVRTAFPTFAVSTQPATVASDVGPKLIEMAAHTIGLDLQLALQPPFRPDLPKREIAHGVAIGAGVPHLCGHALAHIAKQQRCGASRATL